MRAIAPAAGADLRSKVLPTAAQFWIKLSRRRVPVIGEAMVDLFVPPMPAKVTLEQATKFAEALARGEPNGTKIAWTVLSDKVRELI